MFKIVKAKQEVEKEASKYKAKQLKGKYKAIVNKVKDNNNKDIKLNSSIVAVLAI